ncbi:MAG: zinc metalloprotease [Hyphomicrobiales bacterium]
MRFASLAVLAIGLLAIPATGRAQSGAPDPSRSYFVPEAGPTTAPITGLAAAQRFRACPANDGGSSLPQSARIRIVLRDAAGAPLANVAVGDVCVLLNGGTAEQGFAGAGADSIVANSAYNVSPLCPDLRCIPADAPTDANGVTWITFAGADPATPGVALRNPNRKWGHYDSDIPVFALGVRLEGRLDDGAAAGSYTLRVKSFDHAGGLGAVANQGEAVTLTDFNAIANGLGDTGPLAYWHDFDSSGSVTLTDLNAITAHLTHDCAVPIDDGCGAGGAAASVAGGGAGAIRHCGADASGRPAALSDGSLLESIARTSGAITGGVIPVWFHVIHCGTAGDVSDADLDAQIAVMNDHFSGRDYAGVRVPDADSTGYSFFRAGVTRTDNAAWFTMTPASDAEAEAKWALHADPGTGLNLYVCAPGDRYLGWSSFPWDLAAHPALDGIVLHYECLPGGALAPFNLGGVATHEAGHWLGLLHTFEGGCHPDSLCATAGDEVCDTPAEVSPTDGCPTTPKDSCPASAGLDPIHNYMDYSDDDCYTQFTPGQDARMDAMVTLYRASLWPAAAPAARAAAAAAGIASSALAAPAPALR